jgi:hypothetical protein
MVSNKEKCEVNPNGLLSLSPKEALRKADGFANAAVSQYDMASTMEALNVGLTALANPDKNWQQVGERILGTLDHYFDENSLTVKMLLPVEDAKLDAQRIRLQQIKDSFYVVKTKLSNKNRDWISKYSSIADAANFTNLKVIECLQTVKSDQPYIDPQEIIITSSYLKHKYPAEKISDAIKPIADLCLKIPLAGDLSVSFEGPTEILLKIKDIKNSGMPELDNLWERKFGQVSLSDIFDKPVVDPDKFGRRILSFINSLPKGDIFWKNFSETLFFTSINDIQSKGYGFDLTNVSVRLSVFQNWISEQVLLPGITGKAALAGFDVDLKKIMESTYSWHRDLMPIMILNSAIFFPVILENYRDAFDREGIVHNSALLDQLPEDWQDTWKFMGDLRTYDAIPDLIAQHVNEIRNNWQKRFGMEGFATKNLDYILKDIDPKPEFMAEFMTEIRVQSGENFQNNLDTNVRGMDKLNRKMWMNIRSNYLNWPASQVIHSIEFAPDSLADISGIKRINLYSNKLPDIGNLSDNVIDFQLITKNDLVFPARINGAGEITDFGGHLEYLTPGVREYFRLLAISSLSDLTERVKIIRKTPADPNNRVAIDNEQPRGEKRKPAINYLPIKNISYVGKDVSSESINIGSESLAKEIHNLHSADHVYSPRSVGFHPRHFEKWQEFVQQLELLTAEYFLAVSDAEGESGLETVSTAINSLVQGFPKTSKGFPESIKNRLDYIKHPITGEKIYLQTWINKHVSPKIGPDEVVDPSTRWERYYRGRASALSLLDDLSFWFLPTSEVAELTH